MPFSLTQACFHKTDRNRASLRLESSLSTQAWSSVGQITGLGHAAEVVGGGRSYTTRHYSTGLMPEDDKVKTGRRGVVMLLLIRFDGDVSE